MCIHLWLWRRRLSLRPCACAQCRVLPLDLMQLLVAIKRHGTHARCSTTPHNNNTLSRQLSRPSPACVLDAGSRSQTVLASSLSQFNPSFKCQLMFLTVQCEGECLGRLARIGENDAPGAHTVAQNLHQAEACN